MTMNAPDMRVNSLETAETESISAQLCQQFGLRQDPFSSGASGDVSGKHALFFGGGQREHHLENCQHLIHFGHVPVLLTGDAGSGKTRLLAALCQAERQQTRLIVLAASQLTSQAALAMQLRLPLASQPGALFLPEQAAPEAVVSGFFQWAGEQSDQGNKVALILDQADEIADDALRLILSAYLAAGPGRTAALLMAGSDQLPQRVRHLADALAGDHSGADWLLNIPLQPLNKAEVADYVKRLLSAVGGDAERILTEQRLQQIVQLGRGNFARTRRVAPGVLLNLAASRKSGLSAMMSALGQALPAATKLKWMTLLLLLLGLSYVWVSKQYPARTAAVAPDDDVGLSVPATALLVPERRMVRLDAATAAADEAGLDETPVEATRVDASVTTIPVTTTPLANEPAASTDLTPAQIDEMTRVNAAAEAAAAPEVVTEPKVVIEPKAAPAPEPVAKPAFSPRWPEKFRDPAWLAQRGSHATAQIMGLHSEQAIIKFLKAHTDQDYFYVQSLFKGKPWFVILWGDYPDKASLKAALPATVAAQKPWLRSFEGL